jgi:hypothetical protein
MTIRAVIESHGHFAHSGDPDGTARAWAELGFEAREVDQWLSARCFDPNAARSLAAVGVDTADARMKTEAGAGDYTDTVGFKASAGDIEAEEARALIEASWA